MSRRVRRVDYHLDPKGIKTLPFDEIRAILRGNRTVELEEGEFIIVPRRTEHRPIAFEEVQILLFEPASTINTGNVASDLTVHEPERM
jgi:hypothetical protein